MLGFKFQTIAMAASEDDFLRTASRVEVQIKLTRSEIDMGSEQMLILL